MKSIRRVAVLGAGVMGAAIAGHLANVGIDSLLLDMVPTSLTADEEKKGLHLHDKAVRNRLADAGKAGLVKAKPAPLYSVKDLDRIVTGNFEDDFERLSTCDWIIEVVVENVSVKQTVMARIDAVRSAGSIVSSNTSGVSISEMAAGRSDDFRKHFLGTHFFNPPRYMKLLELIPTADTDPAVMSFMTEFGERVLGKGVVHAKDTPNFIANRIGTYGLLVTLREMRGTSFGVDDVDALTGPVLGRPKSATFRTLDIVGLDTFVHVANNVYTHTEDAEEKAVFTVPDDVRMMVERGWIGDKRGQGFFKREKTPQGREILALDLERMEYRPRRKVRSASFEAARAANTLQDKLRTLVYADDEAGHFVWNVLKQLLLYSATIATEIADDIVAIDNAMKWGFSWEQGPFETWDAIGVKKSVARMREEGLTIPPFVEAVLQSGGSFYGTTEEGTKTFSVGSTQRPLKQNDRIIDVPALRAQHRVVMSNRGASLIDIGDGVALLEFHSPKQAIGADLVAMMMKAADEVEKNYEALVFGATAPNFCVGANLAMMLMEAQDENWDEIDLAIAQLQKATMRMKFLQKPVVVAPYGYALGGGAELCFPATHVQMAAETYMGLVEVGVGLLPGGGGNKEVLIRMMEQMPEGVSDVSAMPFVQKAFELIAMAKVSTSAKEAKVLGYARPTDGISMNPDHLLFDAKETALALRANFSPRRPARIPVVGENGAALLKIGVYGMKRSGYISDHDELIAKRIANVLTGGSATAGSLVTEQYLLDLEREAFLSLVGEPKTQARMQHMLKTGKPLRN